MFISLGVCTVASEKVWKVPWKWPVSRAPSDSTVVPPETIAVCTGVCVIISPCSWALVRLQLLGNTRVSATEEQKWGQARSLGHHTVHFVTLGSHWTSLNITFLISTKRIQLFIHRGTTRILDGPGPGCAESSILARVLPNVDTMSCPHGQGPLEGGLSLRT